MSRIKDKIVEIEEYLSELLEILPESFETYQENKEKKAACERYLEKIVEAVVDLAHIYIKEKNMQQSEDDIQTFFILAKDNLISENLARKLKEAKGMRNIIAHEYGEIDDSQVFESLKNELADDVGEFLEKLGGKK